MPKSPTEAIYITVSIHSKDGMLMDQFRVYSMNDRKFKTFQVTPNGVEENQDDDEYFGAPSVHVGILARIMCSWSKAFKGSKETNRHA